MIAATLALSSAHLRLGGIAARRSLARSQMTFIIRFLLTLVDGIREKISKMQSSKQGDTYCTSIQITITIDFVDDFQTS